MYTLLIIIHVIMCIILISTILLQAGRGGGLTEAFGGGETAQSILGTQAPVVLKKITEGSAIAFLVTSLLLGMVTARRGKSLFDRARLPEMPVASQESTSGVVKPNLPKKDQMPEAQKAPQAGESSPFSEGQ